MDEHHDLAAMIIGIPDGVSEEDLYGEGELDPCDPGEPLDIDEGAYERDETWKFDDEEEFEMAAELGIEPGGGEADPFDSLSCTCDDCGETFRAEDTLGRDNPSEELCDHCYAKHYDQ